MTKITETNSTRLFRALWVLLIPVICMTLVACGGSGAPALRSPAAPPAGVVNCNYGATAESGTHYTDPYGAPKCFSHLLAELDNQRRGAPITETSRGAAFIYDYFYDPTDDDEQLELIEAGGLDGNGNYFSIAADDERLRTGAGASARRSYNAVSPYLPGAVITPSLSNTGTSADPNIQRTYSGEVVRLAYTAVRRELLSWLFQPRAIYSFTQDGSHDLFYQITKDLSSLSAFDATSNFSAIPTRLIGVGALGISNEEWSTGFRKQSSALLAAGYFVDGLTSNTVAAQINDRNDTNSLDGVYWDSVELDTDLTDLIASTPTTQLAELVNHNSWRTPAERISTVFAGISGSLATKVTEAGQTRLRTSLGLEKSLLDLLAAATVHARTGHYYAASSINRAGNDILVDTHCGVLRDGCFILSSYTPFFFFTPAGTSAKFAAPRLTAVIDTLWRVWPQLTNLDMHRLLRTCASDLGAPGVDPVYGQGLLDLECLVRPSGGLRIPTAQVAGISGSLIGPSTADTSLATQDDFGRQFSYTAVHTQPHTRAFNPLENAHVHASSQSTMLAVGQEAASAWVTYSLLRDLRMSVGAVYEQASLLGTYGTGHFQIQDGYSSGARLDWIHRLGHLWNTRMHIAYYTGTAQAVHPGAVSELSLRQSSVAVSLERQLSYNDIVTSRLLVSISCNTGTRGSFNSFGTPVTLSGDEQCEQKLGMALHF